VTRGVAFYCGDVSEPVVEPEIAAHYESEVDEGRRLREGLGELELLRTQDVIRRHLAPHELRILDVGGATGVHAAWLAEDGHRVHVIDPIPAQIARARELPAARAGAITCEVGDARHLEHDDESFDAVLMLGPLYHLVERRDRLQALAEGRRVVRSGGLVFVAAISRFASLFNGLARGFIFEPEFAAIVEQDLRDGQHRNRSHRPGWFTTAFFHHPDELRAEIADAELHVREVVGLEGLAIYLKDLEDRWSEPKAREMILHVARVIETESSLSGLGPHLLGVAERLKQ